MLEQRNRAMGRPLTTDELQDVAQETFLVVLRRLPSYRPVRPLEHWIYGVCALELRQAARDKRRRQLRQPSLSPEAPEPVDPSAQDVSDQVTDYADAEAALAALGGVEADVLALRHLEGMTFPEIGRRLAMPANTARTHYHRGLRRLRRLLRGAGCRRPGQVMNDPDDIEADEPALDALAAALDRAGAAGRAEIEAALDGDASSGAVASARAARERYRAAGSGRTARSLGRWAAAAVLLVALGAGISWWLVDRRVRSPLPEDLVLDATSGDLDVTLVGAFERVEFVAVAPPGGYFELVWETRSGAEEPWQAVIAPITTDVPSWRPSPSQRQVLDQAKPLRLTVRVFVDGPAPLATRRALWR